MKLLAFVSTLAIVMGWFTNPEKVAIAWTENENEVKVTFWTILPVNAYLYVAYRPILCVEEDQPFTYVKADTHEKTVGYILDMPRSEWRYTARIPNLRPECSYEYKVGTTDNWSETFLFAGLTPDYNEPYEQQNLETSVLIYGDWGIGPQGERTSLLLDKMAELRSFDAVLHIGDIGYDMEDFFGITGDIMQNIMQPIAANFPYMTIPGNHENYMNQTIYQYRFNMPEYDVNEHNDAFYSFNFGSAHYILFNTEPYLNFDDEGARQTQYNWMKEDLEKANAERDVRPWIIVGTHHPPYCTYLWHPAPYDKPRLDKRHESIFPCTVDVQILREQFEDLWNEHGVDMVFAGHIHNYERTAPVYNATTSLSEADTQYSHLNANAPVYITCGAAGSREGHQPLNDSPPDWNRAQSNKFGVGKLTVHNGTHSYWEQYDSSTGDVVDYVYLVKNQLRYPFPNNSTVAS